MNEQLSQQRLLQQLRNYMVHVSHQPHHEKLKDNFLWYLETCHQFQLPPDVINDLILEVKNLAPGRQDNPIKHRVESRLRQKSKRQPEQWFNYFMWCVPKQIREPWLGDLREDRERMANAGLSSWRIEFATAVQFLFLIGAVLWNFILKLNPFRSASSIPDR